MPNVDITRAVVDIERWLKGIAERAAVISAFATNVRDYVASVEVCIVGGCPADGAPCVAGAAPA